MVLLEATLILPCQVGDWALHITTQPPSNLVWQAWGDEHKSPLILAGNHFILLGLCRGSESDGAWTVWLLPSNQKADIFCLSSPQWRTEPIT